MMFKKREREDPRLQLAGLVDVLFLLIIFFTVSTTFATTGGINVSLPEASSQKTKQEAEKIFVVVDKNGDAFIDGEKMTDRELEQSFLEFVKTDKESVVILQADKKTSHGRVVAVMDLAQSSGLKRLAIATERKPGKGDREREPSQEPSEGGESVPNQ